MRNNAAYLPENPIVYIIFPESIHNRASYAIFEDSTKKVTASIAGGKTRTLYLGNENKNIIHPYYEIEVKDNEKGFSDYSSIKKATKLFITNNTEFKVFE